MPDTWRYPDADNVILGSAEELARRYPCPTCDAPSEAYCVTRTGHPTDVHRTRGALMTTEPPPVPAVSAPPPAPSDEVSIMHLKGHEPRLADDTDRPAPLDERRPTDPALAKAWDKQRAATTPETSDEETTLNPRLLGQTVLFRSRTGAWTAPAIVTATCDSLNRENVQAGHVPDLTDPLNVHLTVLTPGIQGHVSDTTAREHPELVADDRPNKPAGGTFQEWDVPQWTPDDPESWERPFDYADQPAGTWTWPR